MHDWMELFVAGKPFYDVEETSLLVDSSVEPMLADDRHQLLNDADFDEYWVFHR